MITIEEQITQKVPGETSLFVGFPYNAQLLDIIKSSNSTGVFHKETKLWEMPLTSLSYLLDRFCRYDSIQLNLLPDTHKDMHESVELDLSKYKTKPFDYQQDAIKYGLQHDKWLLLDAPGLGKTLTTLLLAQELKEREGLEHCLIICGVNTLKSNWKKEIKLHTNLSCKILGERINTKGKEIIGGTKERLEDLKTPLDEFFLITNIETLRNEDIVKELKKNKVNKIDMILFDECHHAKTVSAAQSRGLVKLQAKHMIAMTGTILTNSPFDAFVPLKWLGIDKSSYSIFKYFYGNFTGQFNNILVGYRNLSILKTQLENHSLRRTKDLLDLPPKTVINEYVEMNEKQQQFYDNVKNGVKDEVDKVELKPANVLAMVGRLRQATACPSILTTEDISSSKLERAVDLTEQIISSGEKVVIFSTYKESLNVLKEQLIQYKPLLCTGDIKDIDIANNINLFQNADDNKIMLATWQKMGTGITLTRATYAIFLDTPWTAADFLQCQDRIYRIGTDKKVFIYNLICKDTVDERVRDIVEDKAAISDYIVDDKITKSSIKNLTKYIEDLSKEE